MTADLDSFKDYAVEALAALCKGAVNAELQDAVGGDAIETIFGVPYPPAALPASAFPALCVYRWRDQDKNLGDLVQNDLTIFRFDYYVGATPRDKIDTRWPMLRPVWEVMKGLFHTGRHPTVANERPILDDAGVYRYNLGSAQAQYAFAPVPNSTLLYPMFTGQAAFDCDHASSASLYDDLDKRLRLADLKTIDVKWDLVPESNSSFEAHDTIEF